MRIKVEDTNSVSYLLILLGFYVVALMLLTLLVNL